MNAASNVIRLHPADNVVVAREGLVRGTMLGATGVAAATTIPPGHKAAIAAIGAGEPIRKYNQIIGFAREPIAPGSHVHVQNVEYRSFTRHAAAGSAAPPETAFVPDAERATFQGFVRADGRVGTRNYVGILPSVNCSATVARYVADAFRAPGALDDFPGVDGVVALVHSAGCGLQLDGEGHRLLRRVMTGYARHPNFGGVLMIGLGCEVNQAARLAEEAGRSGVRTMTIQESGGTRRSVAAGVAAVRELLAEAARCRRETVSASEIRLGLQCGGSDGYSGIGANPALGAASDLLVRHGGTAILSETPEIYGAEHLLVSRAASAEVADKLLARIRWWEAYTKREGGEMDNNPAPGNKAGGLTTILEKALGSAAKGGTTRLNDVFEYAEPITTRGFVFMDSPGYDPASATGQVASGANMICFTTGRGSVFGCKPVPSIKIATNTAMYRRMEEDMDVNCGEIIDGAATVHDKGGQIFRAILEVASGRPSKSEELGFGDAEFVPWQLGAVM
jgi:altronate hydrolase